MARCREDSHAGHVYPPPGPRPYGVAIREDSRGTLRIVYTLVQLVCTNCGAAFRDLARLEFFNKQGRWELEMEDTNLCDKFPPQSFEDFDFDDSDEEDWILF